jgi:lactoylglutathione lyase
MALQAFPVLYANDVESVAGFRERLGFEEHVRSPGAIGDVGCVAMHRDTAELGVTSEASPRTLAGVGPGPGPGGELFVYVEEVGATLQVLRAEGTKVSRDPMDTPWGERVVFVAAPEGNVGTPAMAAR